MRLYLPLLVIVNLNHVLRPPLFRVMELYQPSAVVLQCGADSLSGDRFVTVSSVFFRFGKIMSSIIFLLELLLHHECYSQAGLLQPDPQGPWKVCGIHEKVAILNICFCRKHFYCCWNAQPINVS